ncbi:uncharacterized protein LOC134781988 [Penaeus indicus]|uniref:uncharacterized protein LOC134781988 n=1 Tax=Penaeus indicus TaxID=29960 RepID=UPI00300C7CEC
MVSEGGGSEPAIRVRVRVKAAWNKWRELSGVINDKRMPRKIKVKLYETVVRLVIVHGLETCALTKEERLLVSTEMGMLRRIMAVTLRDRKRSDGTRKELKVCNIIEGIRESTLRWFGHLERAQNGQPAKDITNLTVEVYRGQHQEGLAGAESDYGTCWE